MARSPKYTPQPGQEGKDLVGVRSCGCVTAAMSVSPSEDYDPQTTAKDVREFYVSMAETGREVRWVPAAAIEIVNCPHKGTEQTK